MRNSRFEDISPASRAIRVMNLIKLREIDTGGFTRAFTLDRLFWHLSALLSDLDAAVEKRLLSV